VRKEALVSRHGLVACQNWLAAEAGAAVLARGGNAVDAAVTTLLTLSVVEPWLSGLGGGGFLVRADASGAIDALDFSLVAPRALDTGRYALAEGQDGDWFAWPAVVGNRNLIGPESICVPGAVAGLAAALERFGTIGFDTAVAPAIGHAEAGLRVDWFAALAISLEASELARFPATAALFLREGRAPRAVEGARLAMPAKARMLRRLAERGPRDFYEGGTALRLVEDLRAAGAAISAEDLASYAPHWSAAQVGRYRDLEIAVAPGLNGGPSLLAALDDLSALLPAGADRPQAALAHATAIRRAYQHRLTTMGHGCTSHVSVVDRDGTMVSATNTLLSRFGSKVTAPSAGLLLNNGLMWFDPRPGQPNSIAAGRKPLTNMAPLIARRDGRPVLALGAAGGRQILPALLQLLSYMVDAGLSLEEAFNAPRIDASMPTLCVDVADDPRVAATLARRFPVQTIENTVYPVSFAIPSGVMQDWTTGLRTGMAHPVSPWASVSEG
jgi:gamma-glutamyltranspeptidase/glutathione hydrolase